jgi:hypothetical protein
MQTNLMNQVVVIACNVACELELLCWKRRSIKRRGNMHNEPGLHTAQLNAHRTPRMRSGPHCAVVSVAYRSVLGHDNSAMRK